LRIMVHPAANAGERYQDGKNDKKGEGIRACKRVIPPRLRQAEKGQPSHPSYVPQRNGAGESRVKKKKPGEREKREISDRWHHLFALQRGRMRIFCPKRRHRREKDTRRGEEEGVIGRWGGACRPYRVVSTPSKLVIRGVQGEKREKVFPAFCCEKPARGKRRSRCSTFSSATGERGERRHHRKGRGDPRKTLKGTHHRPPEGLG